jgi:hypothetical protein
MALWGISTTTETAANNYNIPKHLSEADRNNTPWNCFADLRGWVYRRYGTTENSGLSTTYYDEVLVPVSGLNTTGISSNTIGLGAATPVAVFFEDPNKASPISISAGATDRIVRNGQTGYVHVVWNETVFCGAGATVLVVGFNTAGTAVTSIVATASSVFAPSGIYPYINNNGNTAYTTFNGQISNRVAFAFTCGSAGVGTVLTVRLSAGVVGTITDFYDGTAVEKSFASDILRNVAGAGTTSGVGIGATTLTISAA